MVAITREGNDLVFQSPFNRAGVDDLKARIPYSDRQWDKSRKVWLVAPRHAQTLADLAERWWNERVQLPHVATQTAEETKILEVRYLGKAYERETGGERTANAWIGGGWGAVFPESVLRKWFMDDDDAAPAATGPKPQKAKTLYAVLLLKDDATDDEIKKAYRRLAMQWHPDRCHEPDAKEQFQTIQHAYDTLKDPRTRAKYKAGLVLEERARQQALASQSSYRFARQIARTLDANRDGYRSPLRCGYIMVTGIQRVGKFFVAEILGWQDIVNAQGQTLVASWPIGAEEPYEEWA